MSVGLASLAGLGMDEEEIRRLLGIEEEQDEPMLEPSFEPPPYEPPPAPKMDAPAPQAMQQQGPAAMPTPNYSRVDDLRRQMDGTGRGIRRFFKSTQAADNQRRQQLMQMMQMEQNRANQDFDNRRQAWEGENKVQVHGSALSNPDTNEMSVLTSKGGKLDMHRFPGKATSTVNAEMAKKTREAEGEANRQLRRELAEAKHEQAAEKMAQVERLFQRAEGGRNTRAQAAETGKSSRFGGGQPWNPDRSEASDLRQRYGIVAREIAKAKDYGQAPDPLALRRLNEILRRQQELLASGRSGAPSAAGAPPPAVQSALKPDAAPAKQTAPKAGVPPGAKTATNPQTGQKVYWNGKAWVPAG